MEIVVPRCSRSMAIVVLALRARTTMAIERLHLGTTISIERRHSVIIMSHYTHTVIIYYTVIGILHYGG